LEEKGQSVSEVVISFFCEVEQEYMEAFAAFFKQLQQECFLHPTIGFAG